MLTPEKMKHYFKNKFFNSFISVTTKVNFGIITISISVLVIFMFISITYSNKTMLDESLSLEYRSLLFSKNNLDNLLSIIKNYSVIILTDEQIQKSLSSKSPSETNVTKAEILIRNRLSSLIGTFPRINAVIIQDMSGHYFDSGVTVLPENLKNDYKPDNSSKWCTLMDAPYYISVPGASIQPGVISYSCPIYSYNTGNQLGYLTIFIKLEYILQTYSAAQDNTGTTTFIVSKDNIIISHPDESLINTSSSLPIEKFSGKANYVRTNGYFIIFDNYDTLDAYLVSVIPKGMIEGRIYNMIILMLSVGLLIMMAAIYLSSFISHSITSGLSLLSATIKKVNDGNWNVKVPGTSKDEIGLIADNFNNMLDQIQLTTEHLVQEQRLKREFQLELLNQQINPHFLYNTLDNICALAELNRINELTDMINNLTRYYRGVLSKGSVIISLANELQIAASYLNIMQIRYYNTFSYEVKIPAGLMDNTALRLTLQPILENAVYHGFQDHLPGGIIQISSRTFRNYILLIIADNGQGISPESLKKLKNPAVPDNSNGGFGLRNVHERIKLYYGSNYGMKIYSSAGKGTRVILKLPKCSWEDRQF